MPRSLLEGNGGPDPCKQNRAIGQEGWCALSSDSEGVLLVLPAESRLLLVGLVDREGEKHLSHQ